jgi:hypothetical protein
VALHHIPEEWVMEPLHLLQSLLSENYACHYLLSLSAAARLVALLILCQSKFYLENCMKYELNINGNPFKPEFCIIYIYIYVYIQYLK